MPGEWSDSQGNTLRKGVPIASGTGDLNRAAELKHGPIALLQEERGGVGACPSPAERRPV